MHEKNKEENKTIRRLFSLNKEMMRLFRSYCENEEPAYFKF